MCSATAASAAGLIFLDDLNGHPAGTDIVVTTPDSNGLAWTGTAGEIFYVLPGGVADFGPNSDHAIVQSTLSPSFSFSTLPPGEVVHLQVKMRNISFFPAANPLASSRVDLLTGAGGVIYLGELHSAGYWAANSAPAPAGAGTPIQSSITTGQSSLFLLDLYLDPYDEFADGPEKNALLGVSEIVEGEIVSTHLYCGRIDDLAHDTVITAVQLVRNIHNVVFFDDLILEAIATPRFIVFADDLDGSEGDLAGTTPDANGAVWTEAGSLAGELRFGALGGVEDDGPNSGDTIVASNLLIPFDFDELASGSCTVLHVQVTMENIAPLPAANVLESTRLELLTSAGGVIYLGELDTVGRWGANAGLTLGAAGSPISSGATTAQPDPFVLDLYLDPKDSFENGTLSNVELALFGHPKISGNLVGLAPDTVITAVRLVRDGDDVVAFDDLLIEVMCAPQLFKNDLSPMSLSKEAVNDTGQPATGFEWLVLGRHTILGERASPGFFNDFSVEHNSGTTLLRWEAAAPFSLDPGNSASFAFEVGGEAPITLKAAWTSGGVVTGCAPQLTIAPDFVFFFWILAAMDLPPFCPEFDVYVGEISVEWLADEAALEDLSSTADRSPIRTDVLPGLFLIPWRADLPLALPLPPPPNAHFGVIKLSVADNPGLTGASVDFLQVALGPVPKVPAGSHWGTAILIALLASLGASVASRARSVRAR
jgi:hypothetical protein